MSSTEPPIRSRSHPLIKGVRALARGSDDDRVLLEGMRLVLDAVSAGWSFDVVLVRDDDLQAIAAFDEARVAYRLVSGAALDGVGSLKTTPSVVAIAPRPGSLARAELREHLEASKDRVLLAGIAGIADPGNLGALSRSAEAAGATGVVIASDVRGARPFGPKALRGSMGSLLRLPVFEMPIAAATEQLEECAVRQFTARTRAGASLRSVAFGERICIWLGPETGRTTGALDGLEGVTIPMAGAVESLNVTVAGSLLLFEASRGWRA